MWFGMGCVGYMIPCVVLCFWGILIEGCGYRILGLSLYVWVLGLRGEGFLCFCVVGCVYLNGVFGIWYEGKRKRWKERGKRRGERLKRIKRGREGKEVIFLFL